MLTQLSCTLISLQRTSSWHGALLLCPDLRLGQTGQLQRGGEAGGWEGLQGLHSQGGDQLRGAVDGNTSQWSC